MASAAHREQVLGFTVDATSRVNWLLFQSHSGIRHGPILLLGTQV